MGGRPLKNPRNERLGPAMHEVIEREAGACLKSSRQLYALGLLSAKTLMKEFEA